MTYAGYCCPCRLGRFRGCVSHSGYPCADLYFSTCLCVCPGLRLRRFKLKSMQSQSLTLAPIDIHFIPWDSVVLPLGTPVGGNHGGCSGGFQQAPVSRFLDSVATAWGLFHNLDSCPLFGLIVGILRVVQTCVCSPFVTRDSSDR